MPSYVFPQDEENKNEKVVEYGEGTVSNSDSAEVDGADTLVELDDSSDSDLDNRRSNGTSPVALNIDDTAVALNRERKNSTNMQS